MAGDYSEVDFIRAPVVNPDDEIALQDDRVFQLGLRVDPAFVDDVELGAIIGFDETFVLANLTIQDDDGMHTYVCTEYDIICMGYNISI